MFFSIHCLEQAEGLSDWTISVSRKVTNAVMIYIQMSIAVEFIAYVYLFWHLYQYNRNQRGLSNDVMKKRKRCNVISFGGQFASFIIEIVSTTILHVLLELQGTNANNGFIPILTSTCGAILTITFFVASPDLRRFYFTK